MQASTHGSTAPCFAFDRPTGVYIDGLGILGCMIWKDLTGIGSRNNDMLAQTQRQRFWI